MSVDVPVGVEKTGQGDDLVVLTKTVVGVPCDYVS